MHRPAAAVSLVLLAAGCSQATGEQPRAGSCAPFAVVDSAPAAMADGVPTNTVVDLTFSGYPDPDTIDGSDVVLSSGVFTRFGRYDVDLITRRVRFTPRNPLTTDVTFLVTVLSDVKSLQGCAAEQAQRTFRTGDGPATAPPAPPPVTLAAIAIALGVIINMIASIDWSQKFEYVILQSFYRLMAAGLLLR